MHDHFPDDVTALLLVPTRRERDVILAAAPELAPVARICGFGPVAAAARAMQLITEHRPHRVLLAGIAGTYDPEAFPLGSAVRLAACAIDGIGAESPAGPMAAGLMGFPHWPGDAGSPAVGDRVDFDAAGRGLLVTVCEASGSAESADRRRRRHAGALAEDMEGFGVALACALAGVPLVIVRSASNHVGDRAVAGWRIGPALEAVGALLRTIVER